MSVVRADSNLNAGALRSAAIDSRWVVAAVMLCVALPLAIFAPTFADMVSIWRRSETYAHCFLVFPAFVYLVWTQRAELQACPIRPAPIALLGLFACGFILVLGSVAATLGLSFFGLIGMSIFTVVAVLGWRLARVIWVPLLFLFFAVPFGEVFIPYMIEWTADFTVATVRASGVPAYREGPFFSIPTGQWLVVDACSGIRYLLASMFGGWLYAWLIYRSTTRRLAFMAASIVVPIVANWLRAYIIVMLGHVSGNRIATGVDHFIYGWVFFGIVIGLMFWVGAFFREDHEVGAGDGTAGAPLRPSTPWSWRPVLPVAIAAIAIAAGWQIASIQVAHAGDKRPVVVQPVQPANGWTLVARDPGEWFPQLRAPAATLMQRFEKQGRQVSLYVGVYRNQSQESELINSRNDFMVLVQTPWQFVSSTTESIDLGHGQVSVNSAFGRRNKEALLAWQWYWMGEDVTASDFRAKAGLALDRLLGRNDTSAWVAIYGIDADDGKSVQAGLREFAAEMGPAIDAALRETARR